MELTRIIIFSTSLIFISFINDWNLNLLISGILYFAISSVRLLLIIRPKVQRSMKRIPAFLLLIIACSPMPALDNFNLEKWKNDEHGCKSLRKAEISSLMEQRTNLMGLSEEQIIKLLGNPDETNLYQRTQKFLVYYTSPGPKCDMPEAGASRFEIRISALHVVNEVVHYP